MRFVFARRAAVALALVLLSSAAAGQQPPLHDRIDALIEAAAVGSLNPPAGDADFFRRAHLDLTGMIPTATEARAFFADASSDKRQRLIEQLLVTPQHARHLAIALDVMLLERRGDKTMKATDWEDYLRGSLAENKPLDQLFRELIVADGADESPRPAARFFLNRDCEPNAVTRDIGRMFFGMDLQCAQCHDHPLVEDYLQADYYGLFAFVMRSGPFNDAKQKLMQVAEKADGEASFKSVFTTLGADNVAPRLPKGASLLVEPTFAKGEEYVTAPAKNVRGVPKYSRRAQLAARLGDSREFRRNLANRLWAHLFGRGLVHPVDFHHPANPPSHPELLTLLADELARTNFDARAMLRELALTRAYGRSCDAPQPAALDLPLAAEEIARLETRRAELVARSEQAKAALDKAHADRQGLAEQVAELTKQLADLETAAKTASEAADKAAAEQKLADEAAAQKKEQVQLVTNAALRTGVAVKKLPEDQAVAQAFALLDQRVKALTAEAETATTAAAELKPKTTVALDLAKTAGESLAAARALLPHDELARLERAVLDAQHQLREAHFATAALDAQIATAGAIGQWQANRADATLAQPAWNAVLDRWTTGVQLGRLRPLTAEQFALSLLQAGGEVERQHDSLQAAYAKSPPEPLKNAAEADRPRVLADLVERKAFSQLRGDLKAFVDLFGTQPGDDFQATVNQALFFGNGAQVQSLLSVGGNLPDRLAKLDDSAAVADELYLAVLTRLPSQEERDDVTAHLKDRAADRAAAAGELMWALVSSNEFRFNH